MIAGLAASRANGDSPLANAGTVIGDTVPRIHEAWDGEY